MGKKHNYPSKRRSPIEHYVPSHKRLGRTIPGFTRGKGTRSAPRRSKIVGNPKEDSSSIGVHAFTVNFTYGPNDGESVIVFSDDYQNALDEAWEERKDTRIPISVEAIDPDIKAALKWMLEKGKKAVEYGAPRIKKATHLGARYTVRAGKAGLRGGKGAVKGGAKLVAFGVQSKLIESLLKLCYQENKTKRIAARVALKKRYPSVYAMCDFSPGGYRI